MKKLNEKQKVLIDSNKELVYKFVHRTFPNENWESKQDLINEGIAIICDKINTFDEKKGKYSTWVYTVLGFLLRNYYNKNRYRDSKISKNFNKNVSNEERIDSLYSQLNQTDADIMERELDTQSLRENLSQLEELERKVIMLFFCDYKPKEICDICNIAQSQIYYIKNTALNKLRGMMI